jgi:hypothetical protein
VYAFKVDGSTADSREQADEQRDRRSSRLAGEGGTAMQDQDLGQTPSPPGPDPTTSAPSPPPPPPGLFADSPAPATTPPPATPPTAAPAPASPAASATATAPPPTRPPKKKSRGCLIAVIVALVFLCALCGIGGIVLAVFSAGSAQTAKITQADAHWNAATSAVETATAALDKAGNAATGSKTTAAIQSIDRSLRTARDELAASRASIEQIDESVGRTDYLAAIAEGTRAIDGLEKVVAYLGTANQMLDKATEAGAASSRARKALDLAIQAGNASQYSLMKSRARSAANEFIKSGVVFREAAKLDSTAGLDKAAAYVDIRRQQADIIVGMADKGAAHKATAYNADIKRLKALDAKATKIGDPAIIEDPDWAKKRLATMGKDAASAGKKADELHARALKELKYEK